MNILLNALTQNASIVLFDDNRQILDTVSINISSQESQSLAPILDEYVQNKCGGIHHLKNLLVVVGPGSFTAIRSIVLTVNTMAFIYPHIHLTAHSFFSLFDRYPIIKSSSKKDAYIQLAPGGEIYIWKNEQILEYCQKENIKTLFGECEELSLDLKFENTPTYDTIISDIEFTQIKQLDALYIKKPSIS